MVNVSSSTAAEASFNFGGGLIEIAALTALIGSTTAESLVLGNRGAAGLLWGTMSSFGALSVIKACIAAATPGWLRDTFGVRNKETDDALGIMLTLSDKNVQSRRRTTGICGVACSVSKDHYACSEKGQAMASSDTTEISRHDVYAFDQSVSGILDLIPSEETKELIEVYLLLPDLYRQEKATRIRRKDYCEAFMLCIVSFCCWAYFLCASIILDAAGLSREISRRASERELDLLAGHLPTPLKAGGQCKLVLGAPHNVRHSKLWKIAWGFGSLVSTASVIAAYMALSSQGPKVFAVWAGFQCLWLMLRSAFFHFAENTDRIFQHPILVKKEWTGLSRPLKARVRGIVQTLSLYQMHVHPRDLYSYEEDDRTIRDKYTLRLTLPPASLPTHREGDSVIITLSISAVIGDTLLSSATFITGRKFASLDQYDTCVVIIKTNEGDIAIPAARIVTGKPPSRNANNVEAGFELDLPPKGTANRGKFDLTWWYWIPCEGDVWLELHTTNMQILGERRAKILTGAAVTKHLASGELHVSISEVSHVMETVQNSRLGFEALQSLLR
ncbi:MAG: hypothetical protein Q9170_005942 [Blastenia crenularia]